MTSVALAYGPELESYRFGPTHPMQPERFSAAVSLMRSWDLLGPGNGARILTPVMAADSDLLLAHTADYIAAVREADDDPYAADSRYGLGPGDTPAFAGMHRAAGLAVGATLLATRAVTTGDALRAFSPAGGLHHAHRDRAAGFCIYNDCVVAIERTVLDQPAVRIAYVDIDAHHGDGVQEAFYGRADVLTLSVHESGSYLYPGTGHPREIGEGPGLGAALNVALPPYADDQCYREVLQRAIVPAVTEFAPDLIFLQGGADTHRADPLTHLALSVAGYADLVGGIVALADTVCDGRLIMAGGGGYEPYSAVPRMWACAMALLLGRDIPATVPPEWLAETRRHVPDAPSETLAEATGPAPQEATQEALALTRRVLDQLSVEHPLLSGTNHT